METAIKQKEPIRINGYSFLDFINVFRGKRIIDKNGHEVPKFVLFWSKKSIKEIKENYKFVDRE